MSDTIDAEKVDQLMSADLTPGELIYELRKLCRRLKLDVRGLVTYQPDMGSQYSVDIDVEVWGCRHGLECQTYRVYETDKRAMATLAKCAYMARIIKATI